MKTFFVVVYALLITINMEAQVKSTELPGEYYLQGVPETASGFKFNADSTFEFFFSYGALDRFGKGNWLLQKGQVILNSYPSKQQDFKLLESSTGRKDSIEIKLVDDNPVFLSAVLAKIHSGKKIREQFSDRSGVIKFASVAIDSLELFFEFSSERSSIFHNLNPAHHTFRFELTSEVMEVHFNNFSLNPVAQGLSGIHPLLQPKAYTFVKAR